MRAPDCASCRLRAKEAPRSPALLGDKPQNIEAIAALVGDADRSRRQDSACHRGPVWVHGPRQAGPGARRPFGGEAEDTIQDGGISWFWFPHQRRPRHF